MTERPDAGELAGTLKTRWGMNPALTVEAKHAGTDEHPEITLVVTLPTKTRSGTSKVSKTGGREQYSIRVGFESAKDDAKKVSPVERTIDALDALVGQLVESGFAHRDLPSGSGVEFAGGYFSVEVEKVMPDLEKWADEILSAN